MSDEQTDKRHRSQNLHGGRNYYINSLKHLTGLLYPILPLLFPQFISVSQCLVFLDFQLCNFVLHLLLQPQQRS